MLSADVSVDPTHLAITSALRVFDRAPCSSVGLHLPFVLHILPYGKDARSELSWLKIIGVGVRGRLWNCLLVLYV